MGQLPENTTSRPLRRDAQGNMAKVRTAALTAFLTRGLDVPLEEIARAAGVSVGTVYNRFGSRETLIDDVIPPFARVRLTELAEMASRQPTARDRFEHYTRGLIELQRDQPALNDALLRRFPDAARLHEVCSASLSHSRQLLREAHDEGSVSSELTEDDLVALFWLAGTAARTPESPDRCSRIIDLALAAV